MKIGVDLGGTKIEAIALLDDGREVARRRVPAPRGNYDATLAAVVSLVSGIETTLGSRASVGVGMPGAISPATGLVKNANSTWLNGRPLAHDLPRLLDRPVRFENDANCFALSESTDGAGAGRDVVFGVIVGTGVGGGIVVGGRVVVGANAIAGEWGHNPLPAPTDEERPGPACYCGRRACVETFLSGSALTADYDAVTPAHDIARLAAGGDVRADAALQRYEDRMARALATVINVLDPDVIVLGGGLSNIERLYTSVPSRWGRYVFSDRVSTPLVRAAHGDSSGVRGAAWLWD
ncbi:MAG TPA: ROK family protein [Vicinamibacterales bacterium]|nr:ROK family protein [Vicinamibacterales bacterium]